MELPDGIVAVVKRDCPTCRLVAPVLDGLDVTVVSEDDDAGLELSYRHEVITVPTLMRVEGGCEIERIVGWSRRQWEAFTGIDGLGPGLPEHRPGCGSLSVDPGSWATARGPVRSVGAAQSRGSRSPSWRTKGRRSSIAVGPTACPSCRPPKGACCACSTARPARPTTWSPSCRPTSWSAPSRRSPSTRCSPGVSPSTCPSCSPRSRPRAPTSSTSTACSPRHASRAPWSSCNGPIRRAIGMNSGGNVLGQGNRANSTIGRALQLVIRNVGGGRPGGVDRATLGNPGKLTFCFAEDEEGSPWEPLVGGARLRRRARRPSRSSPGEGPACVVDQLSRDPESLARSLAACLRSVQHPKLPLGFDAVLVVGPEHARVFQRRRAGRRQRLRKRDARAAARCRAPRSCAGRAASPRAPGVPGPRPTLPKFRPGGLLIVHAGGGAGLFSADHRRLGERREPGASPSTVEVTA